MSKDSNQTLLELANHDLNGATLLAIQVGCFDWFYDNLPANLLPKLNPALK